MASEAMQCEGFKTEPEPRASDVPSEDARSPEQPEAEEDMPLLFMDGLPRNYLNSAAIAALASLVDSDSDSESGGDAAAPAPDAKPPAAGAGGGRAAVGGRAQAAASERRRQRQQGRAPYARPASDDAPSRSSGSARHASAGEAQILLSLWKM
eukprot:TRINITY_DN10012_c0_g1_i1.p1 TRINITY_DN10012_c0_g1~~TRINITY_DN10012_c0_g1_i1.p1  ORF type:complete len:153 (-),score=55.47 TRINITY_DN10012_c0_g1_i1:41-499(-)